MSKLISENIYRLQRHNFNFEDGTYDELSNNYNNCRAALKWWTNSKQTTSLGYSSFNINYKKYLKEFILENKPEFKVSNKCCQYSKKDTSKKFIQKNNIDLSIVGVRKSEGGLRSSSYKNCYSVYSDKCDQYRPIFFYKNSDKKDYEKCFDIKHSKCYTQYGLTRTGCVGCPYNLTVFDELEIARKYEPKLYKACCNIFKNSYEYTKRFYEFRNEKIKEKERDHEGYQYELNLKEV